MMFEGLRTLDVKVVERYERKIASLKKMIVDPQMTKSVKLQAKDRIMYYKRRYTYKMGSMRIFFTKKIKAKHLKTISGKYYRFALVLKLVLFEIIVVSGQMLPKL